MWKRSFRARPPSKKSASGRCENEAFARDLPQNPKVEDVKTKPSCETSLQKVKVEDVKTKLSHETSLKIWKWKMWKQGFRARPPSKLKVEDVKTRLSCKNSLKIWKWKMWKRGFREGPPSKLKAADVKTKLSRETSLKIWKRKMWRRGFRARPPSKSESGRCENEAFARDLLQNLKVEDVKTRLSCETSLKIWKGKMWRRGFRARPPSKSESGRCENEAFARDLPPNLKVEDVKTRLSCETSLKTESCRCENEAFARDLPQNLKGEDVKTRLSRETPSKSESGRCENEAFARDLPPNLKVEDVKTRLLCETSLKTESCRCENEAFALTSLCSDNPLLWHSFALTSLGFDISLLWHPSTLTPLCFDIPLLWHLFALFALTSLFCDILKIRTTEVRPSNFLWQHLTPAVAKPSLAWLRIDGNYTITRRIQGTKMGQSPLLGYRAKSRTQIMLRQEVLITSLCMGLRGTM